MELPQMNNLPLYRDSDGDLQFQGTPVALRVDYKSVLGKGGQGVVFRGQIIDDCGSLVLKVAVKVNKVVHDPFRKLQDEATMHVYAWTELDDVIQPLGFLAAHESTGTPAMLVMEIGVPFELFLTRAGPLVCRHFDFIKAVARIIFQVLRFIVSGDSINMMHRDIKMQNVFVTNARNLALANSAVGDFGAAQHGEQTASFIYAKITAKGTNRRDICVDHQLTLYNDLFGWARIAVTALADKPPPDTLYGPSPTDYALVPDLGHGKVLDGVHYLLHFALDLLTVGKIDEVVNSEYINGLEWYRALSGTLDGNADASVEEAS